MTWYRSPRIKATQPPRGTPGSTYLGGLGVPRNLVEDGGGSGSADPSRCQCRMGPAHVYMEGWSVPQDDESSHTGWLNHQLPGSPTAVRDRDSSRPSDRVADCRGTRSSHPSGNRRGMSTEVLQTAGGSLAGRQDFDRQPSGFRIAAAAYSRAVVPPPLAFVDVAGRSRATACPKQSRTHDLDGRRRGAGRCRASKWFRLAANQGDAKRTDKSGPPTSKGDGFRKITQRSFRLRQSCADQGQPS